MNIRTVSVGIALTLLISSQSFAQDDLFTIDKSDVQPSWQDDALNTEISEIAIPSLLTGRKTPVMIQASYDQFEAENATLLPLSPEGVSRATAQRLISMAYQAHVRKAVPPAWFDIYHPGGNINELSARRPEEKAGSAGNLRGRGFTPEGYFVADHVVHNIIFARYYFEVIKDDRTYFQPINSIDPANKTVTLWQRVKTNIEADAQLQIVKARIEKEKQETAQLEAERRRLEAEANQIKESRSSNSSSNPAVTYAPPKPRFFTGDFGPAPLSKEMQEIVDAGKGRTEGVYETRRQCRLVADNDSVFIRSKKICEDVQVLVGTRRTR